MRPACVRRVLLSGVLLGVMAGWTCRLPATVAAAAAPSPEQQAGELVGQLGDDSFQARQRAMRELIALGLPAKQALLDGLQDDDPEVRWRCRHVLESVLELDLRARLARFAADEDGAQGLTLPGWERYRELAGDEPAERELFVEMQRAEPDLLEAADNPSPLLDDALLQRCAQLQQTIFAPFASDSRARRQAPLGSVAALLFVATQPEVQVSDALISYLHTFSFQPAFTQAMTDPRRSKPLRKLLGTWVGRGAGSQSTYHNFMLALQYNLSEALEPAKAALKAHDAQPYAVQYALLVVGRFGSSEEYAPLIERLLDDKNVLGTNNIDQKEVRTEVRDVALAILVHLAGEDHGQYGFKYLQKNPQSGILPLSAGFANEKERSAAIEKWRQQIAPKEG